MFHRLSGEWRVGPYERMVGQVGVRVDGIT